MTTKQTSASSSSSSDASSPGPALKTYRQPSQLKLITVPDGPETKKICLFHSVLGLSCNWRNSSIRENANRVSECMALSNDFRI